jgi:hypothetical protein
MVTAGMDRAPERLQEHEDDQHHQEDGDPQGEEDLLERLAHHPRGVEGDAEHHPGGKRPIQPVELGGDAFFTASALALGSWYTPRPTALRSLNRRRLE